MTDRRHSTNSADTFMQVAEDCPVTAAEVPPVTAKPTVAALQYELIFEHPYELTSDDVLLAVHMTRHGIGEEEREATREVLFSTGQPCLRSSALGKRYGWGVHHDAQGRVALVPLGSERYAELAADANLTQVRAMRSRRA